MLSYDDKRIIIDSGPDFRMQMLRKKIDKIDAILYTHEHADHTAGLDDIRPLYFRLKKPLPIYAQSRVLADLRQRFDYIFTEQNRYPGAPEVDPHTLVHYQSFSIGNKEITPLKILHGNLPITAYRIEDIAYITDAKYILDESIKHLQNLEVLIINALHHKPHKMHLNLTEALAIIEQLQPKKAILTHISHHMGFYDEMSKKLPKNVYLAYDGMEIGSGK